MISDPQAPVSDVEETRYGQTSPSLLLAAPSALLGISIGLVLCYFVIPILVNPLVGQFVSPLVIWAVIWLLCLSKTVWKMLVLATTQYEITSQRIFYKRGVFNRHKDQLEIVRIRDLSTYRPFIQRLVGLGTLKMDTVDRTHPTMVIPGLYDVDALKDFLHKLNAAERVRLGYREFESTM